MEARKPRTRKPKRYIASVTDHLGDLAHRGRQSMLRIELNKRAGMYNGYIIDLFYDSQGVHSGRESGVAVSNFGCCGAGWSHALDTRRRILLSVLEELRTMGIWIGPQEELPRIRRRKAKPPVKKRGGR